MLSKEAMYELEQNIEYQSRKKKTLELVGRKERNIQEQGYTRIRGLKSRNTKKQRDIEEIQSAFRTFASVLICQVPLASRCFKEVASLVRGTGGLLMLHRTNLLRHAILAAGDLHIHRAFFSALKKTERDSNRTLSLVFTNEQDLGTLVNSLEEMSWTCSLKDLGSKYAPNDVVLPTGNTGLCPTRMSLFQAMGIPSLIQRGQIALQEEVLLVKQGEEIMPSAAHLITAVIGDKAFKISTRVIKVYSRGRAFDPHRVLFVPDYEIIDICYAAVNIIHSISKKADIDSQPRVGFALSDALKSLMSISAEIDYEMQSLKEERTTFEIEGAIPFEFDWAPEDKKLFS